VLGELGALIVVERVEEAVVAAADDVGDRRLGHGSALPLNP